MKLRQDKKEVLDKVILMLSKAGFNAGYPPKGPKFDLSFDRTPLIGLGSKVPTRWIESAVGSIGFDIPMEFFER